MPPPTLSGPAPGGGGTAKSIATGLGTFLGGPVGGLAGNIIGGLFGSSGQSSANRANARLARENREWQERMSNTAYQRSAADLEKAGLNRILALGGPSSTPAGNVAKMENTKAPLQAGINAGITTALQARKQKAEIQYIEANTQKTLAEAGLIPVQGQKLQSEIKNLGAQYGLTTAQTQAIASQVDLTKANAANARQMTKKLMEETKISAAAAQRAKLENDLYQGLYSGDLGAVLYAIKQLAIPIASMGVGMNFIGRKAGDIATNQGKVSAAGAFTTYPALPAPRGN